MPSQVKPVHSHHTAASSSQISRWHDRGANKIALLRREVLIHLSWGQYGGGLVKKLIRISSSVPGRFSRASHEGNLQGLIGPRSVF